MKRSVMALRAAIILAGVLTSLSCSLMEPRRGSMLIPFPPQLLRSPEAGAGTGANARALLGAGDTLTYVRVYLEAQGGLVPLAGTALVFESEIPANNTITIEGVPPIRNCTLYIALSAKGTPDFRIVKYVKSGLFNVIAGATATVELTALQSPFVDKSTAADPKGVRALWLGGVTYTLANGRLSWVEGLSLRSLAITGTNGIAAVNGISAGQAVNDNGSLGGDRVWINTDKGVWILAADGASLAQLPVKDSNGAARSVGNILESGTIRLSYTSSSSGASQSKDLSALFYQGLGKVGCAISSGDAWTWYDIADYLDKAGTLRSSIEGATSKLIADYAIEDRRYGYSVVPSINSLRIGGEIVDKMEKLGGSTEIQTLLDTFLTGNTISVPKVSGAAPLIKSVAKAGDTLFVGTDMGLFTMAVDSDGKLTGQPVLVTLGKTTNVFRVRAKQFVSTGPVWAAVLTKGGTLYLVKNGALVATWPFYTGIPEFGGDASATGDIFWTDEGLFVTGTNGVVLFATDQLAM